MTGHPIDHQEAKHIAELKGDESDLARGYLELDAEIAQLRDVIRKACLLATTKSLTIEGYRNALTEIRRITESAGAQRAR